jgi:hypothetical protein
MKKSFILFAQNKAVLSSVSEYNQTWQTKQYNEQSD